MEVWDFGAEDHAVPDAYEIEQARSLIGWELLELDPLNRTVRLPIEGMSIDLGGVAKGYAAREGARILQEHGISHALIDAGETLLQLARVLTGNRGKLVFGIPGAKAWKTQSAQRCLQSIVQWLLPETMKDFLFMTAEGTTTFCIRKQECLLRQYGA